jgi:hypothetical protein
MAVDARLQALIAALGTAQPERDDPRRDPGSAPLDDRDTAAQLAALRALAPYIRHYARSPEEPPGDWSAAFPAGDLAALRVLAARADGGVAPHHALLLAFLQLLARPRALLNRFTAEHLQFQMRQVLGFVPQPPEPDRAHLLLQLKKNAAPAIVGPAQAFSAGKDASGVDQRFVPVRDTVIGTAQVAQLAGVARRGADLRFAPVAASADGLGAPLTGELPQWPAFGADSWPAAPVGFAVASPLLRLAEGQRRIRLRLALQRWPADLAADALAASLDAYLTGPKGWIGPLALTGIVRGNELTLSTELPATAEPVVDHDSAIHMQPYPAALPVMQCVLRAGAALGYERLAGLAVRRIRVRVGASGMRGLLVENDDSAVDPAKAFLPFGAQPVPGARLHVGCTEALAKRLTSLAVHFTWHGAPPDLVDWYDGYARRSLLTNGVAATLSWQDRAGTEHQSGTVTLLPRQAAPTTLTIDGGGSATAYSPQTQQKALESSGSAIAQQVAHGKALARPTMRFAWAGSSGIAEAADQIASSPFAAPTPPPPGARAGFVTIALVEDLLHADFARDAAAAATPPANAKIFTPKLLNPPYTPKVQELTLDYEAESDDSRIDDPSPAAFTDTEVQFFHIDALGPAREQAWLRAAKPWAPQGAITLLAPHADAGELWIGLAGVAAGDAFSLLMQVAEGSADPLAHAQTLRWWVLADNDWRELGPGELALDTTRQLRASGLVAGVLPRETTTTNTRAPAGMAWLRATIAAEPGAACNLVAVAANAIEVVFVDQGNDPARLASPLAAGSIAKLTPPLASIKSVQQPYAGFGGRLAEADDALARRAGERLRHRDRAVTPWDYERLALQAFPSLWRAKCVPHADERCWQAAGRVSLIVVPDLRGRNAVDVLAPRVDLDTLEQVRTHLQARAAPQVQVHVRSPVYQAVQLDFRLRLRPGYGFATYGPQTDLALRQALAPWAFDSTAPLGFGTQVVRSQLLDHVEALPWVDFVTDFRLRLEGAERDMDEILPDAPDVILTSAASHRIQELVDG